MNWFSHRVGAKPIKVVVQLETMDDDLKTGIWNVLLEDIFHVGGFVHTGRHEIPKIFEFARRMCADLLKLPADILPNDPEKIYEDIRLRYFKFTWNEVYDFVEFVVGWTKNPRLADRFNAVFEREMAGYRIAAGRVAPITTKHEIEAIEQAVVMDVFPGAAEHLRRSLEMISDRKAPDIRNSIKESISAVESAAKVLTKKTSATLDEALKELEKKNIIHPSLKAGFLKLYGYACDEDGVRHAMIEQPNLTKADGMFFLISCSAFINYLKSKL